MATRRAQGMIAATLLTATVLAGALAPAVSHPNPPVKQPLSVAAPAGGPIRFSGTLDRTAVVRGGDGIVRMELVMSAAPGSAAEGVRRPTDLVVVLDRSGSMAGDKMVHARAAVRQLLAQLTAGDRFALVTYSNDALVHIPLTQVDARTRPNLLLSVDSIAPDGGTNMASGLDRGFDLIEASRGADRVPHMLLISDGLANQGDSSPDGLRGRAGRAARAELMLSTVGVGSDFNEQLMTSLADAGTGNYYYVQDTNMLSDVFAREFHAARETVASGLAVTVSPASGVKVVDAAGYPLESAGNQVVFRPGSLFAGQERRVWLTLAVPHDALGETNLGEFSLAYTSGSERQSLSLEGLPQIACVQGDEEFYSRLSPEAWSRSTVVEGYSKMQEDVARQVQSGDREAAVARLRSFRAEAEKMNQRLQQPAVAAQLREVDKLEDQVTAAFTGPGQEARRNDLGKAANAQALDTRRAGSKK